MKLGIAFRSEMGTQAKLVYSVIICIVKRLDVFPNNSMRVTFQNFHLIPK